ncbi:bifunctional diguanylate cyclase/phosphodiesterase [Chitiniphilus eburneus]|uniref:EAL domain-containing protein n=1 Tax=Chitiniphilus eburneus TaxID=2571148 RepID=A0A4U0PXZ1_9NEIS|nr:EAL domain-containing protein [Chitiniphilus eburneus]TJZ73473.1 EAL domain-containing protein [Chitiniphilus eburneus]
MSLLRQLWIMVITITLLAFAGSFAVSMLTARNYLEQQLYVQSADNAAALALSMSQQSKDDATAQLMVTALFDSGHFELVRYTDVAGRVVVERANHAMPEGVPVWFMRLFPIHVGAGQAEVSDGWHQAGRVTVLAHSRYAYLSLWAGAFRLLIWILAAGLLAGIVMQLLFRWVRRPIVQMVDQAEAISERRFITITEPRVIELRQVVRAMNTMVARVKTMFAEQAARIEALRSEANRDPLTQLANRNFFMGRLAQALENEEFAPSGCLLLLRIRDLAGINRRLGRERADQFLQFVAGKLASLSADRHDWLLARLNGADFGLLAPGLSADEAPAFARELLENLAELRRIEITDESDLGTFGIAAYRHGDALSTVLTRADQALAQAEETSNAVVLLSDSDTQATLVAHDWHTLLTGALTGEDFLVASFPVLDRNDRLLHRELMLRLCQPDGRLLTAGAFMPHASRLGLMPVLDLETVRLGLVELGRVSYPLAINLSSTSIADSGFVDRLVSLLRQHRDQAGRLWFEVNEFGFRDELRALAAFGERVRPYGCKIGIEHFGRHFGSIPQLYDLQLDYLKIDGSFIQGIDEHPGNQQLIKAIVGIAEGNDMLTIAEGVHDDGEWLVLAELGVQGWTGPAATGRLQG